MQDRRSGTAAWLSAIGLAAVTLFVFAVLQDYGPESAIRRFHEAVFLRDLAALRQVSAQDLDDPAEIWLVRSVRQEAAGGYRVLAMRREPDRVIAEIEYVPEQDRSVWTVVKRGHVWLVDAEQTARALGAGL